MLLMLLMLLISLWLSDKLLELTSYMRLKWAWLTSWLLISMWGGSRHFKLFVSHLSGSQMFSTWPTIIECCIDSPCLSNPSSAFEHHWGLNLFNLSHLWILWFLGLFLTRCLFTTCRAITLVASTWIWSNSATVHWCLSLICLSLHVSLCQFLEFCYILS